MHWQSDRGHVDKPAVDPLVLGTFNVKTNIIYIQNLLKTYDILFIQETWLFNFQLLLLREYFSSHVSFHKAVDENNPLPPMQKPRGYGGVACLVRKNLDFIFKFQSNCGSRVLALEILCEPPLFNY